MLKLSGLATTPVLYLRGKVVGGLLELRVLADSGQLYKRLDAIGVPYRKI